MIKTEFDYKKALVRLERIKDSNPGTKEGEELITLTEEIMKWEDIHCNLPNPTLQDKISFAMDQFGLQVKIGIKNFKTVIRYNHDDNVFYGKIEDIKDLILFEGKTIDKVCDAFIDAVDDYIELKKSNPWIPVPNSVFTFHLSGEPELIHIIKTGFKDKYMVVYEDAYELHLGEVIFGTKKEIEEKYKISL